MNPECLHCKVLAVARVAGYTVFIVFFAYVGARVTIFVLLGS